MTDSPLSPSRKAAIRARAEQATAGPWHAEHIAPSPYRPLGRCDGIVSIAHNHEFDKELYEQPDRPCSRQGCPGHSEIVTTDSGVYGPDWPDADFIAHARTDIPDLLAELDRLTQALAEAQKLQKAYRTAAAQMHDGIVGAGTAGLYNITRVEDGIRLFDEAEAACGLGHLDDIAEISSYEGRLEHAEQALAAVTAERDEAIKVVEIARALRYTLRSGYTPAIVNENIGKLREALDDYDVWLADREADAQRADAKE